MEKQKTASDHEVMKISKVANSAETLLFRTRRGEIDPGEQENCFKTPRHENFENREFGRNSFISDS